MLLDDDKHIIYAVDEHWSIENRPEAFLTKNLEQPMHYLQGMVFISHNFFNRSFEDQCKKSGMKKGFYQKLMNKNSMKEVSLLNLSGELFSQVALIDLAKTFDREL